MGKSIYTYSDGGARGNPGPAAIGIILATPNGEILDEHAECIGTATNNMAEYRAMLKAIELAKAKGATRLLCHADSELIVFQLQGAYRIKDSRLGELAQRVKSAAAGLKVRWVQVPREHPMIRRADKRLNEALNRARAVAPLKRADPVQGEMF